MGPYMYFDCATEIWFPGTHIETRSVVRWKVPKWRIDDLVPLINKYQEENDGLQIQYPDEGYSCSVWMQSEAIAYLLKQELASDIKEFLEEFSRFLTYNPAYTKDIEVTIQL